MLLRTELGSEWSSESESGTEDVLRSEVSAGLWFVAISFSDLEA